MISHFAIVVGRLAQNKPTTVNKCNDDGASCGCSRRPTAVLKNSRGKSASHGGWGWAVSLRDSNNYLCGGSILNEWYIVTAAHCLAGRKYSISGITVCAGTFRLSDSCHQIRAMSSMIFHPLYNKKTLENDIALVRLRTPFNLSDSSVTPICLPSTDHPDDYPAVGTNVVSIGWGDPVTGKTPNALHEATLTIKDHSSVQCQYLTNHALQICAGGSGKGATSGDSGGPLMVLTASNQWELIGVTSFYGGKANPNFGSGYTRITSSMAFIQENLSRTSMNTATIICSCHCPRGTNSGHADSTVNSLAGCVQACTAVPSNSCISSNTFACLGTQCAESDDYESS